MKFNIIVADPPWKFKDKLTMDKTKRGAEANYKGILTNEDIKNLSIKPLMDDWCILNLWVPGTHLAYGLEVMKAWGFTYKQNFIFIKEKKDKFKEFKKTIKNIFKKSEYSFKDVLENMKDISLNNELGFGMGRLFRQTHEICLIGINNNKVYKHLKNKSQRSVCFAINEGHSAKPEEFQNRLELMFPTATNKLELFARRERNGWICLGNEIGKCEDIRVSLPKLINDIDIFDNPPPEAKIPVILEGNQDMEWNLSEEERSF